jgi:hypothetical protein
MTESQPEPEEKRISEAAATYDVSDMTSGRMVILQEQGRPVAVVIPYSQYEEYHRLQERAADQERQRKEAWKELEQLLAKIHSRPTELTPEEIEAEITAAYKEAREMRHENCGRC